MSYENSEGIRALVQQFTTERKYPLNVTPKTIIWYGLGGGSLFDMDGFSFGLKVCLDHGQKRLQKSGAGPVKVQLIPACGKSIQDDAKHMMANGFIFNVCGNSVHSVAQKAPGTDIPGADNAFVSAVIEYNQLFPAPGTVTVHPPHLIPPLK